jgi:multidrug efflux pump subunit AcrA (membrane-fusion protein)
VVAGQLLARLDNADLDLQYQRKRREYEQYQEIERAYRSMSQDDLAARAREGARYAYQALDRLNEERAKLDLRVPAGKTGVALSPPKLRDAGRLMESGDLFCQIGDPTQLEAYVVVPQTEIGLIQEQQSILSNPRDVRMWFKFSGHVGGIMEGRLARISKDEITELPPALSNKNGGLVQTRTDPESERELPIFRSYAILANIDNADQSLKPGLRGMARFDVGYRSIYWRVKRYIQQTLNFRL